MITNLIESTCYHVRMRAMRTLYARDANVICARHEIRPRGPWRPATLGGLREMQRLRSACRGLGAIASAFSLFGPGVCVKVCVVVRFGGGRDCGSEPRAHWRHGSRRARSTGRFWFRRVRGGGCGSARCAAGRGEKACRRGGGRAEHRACTAYTLAPGRCEDG